MDQLPVSGRCVPSQGSEEICNRSDFCYSGRHWTVNVFFISGWAGLCSLANQVRAVHSRLPSTSHQPPPTQSRIKSFGSFRCGTELCCSAPTVWRGCSRRSALHCTFYYILITILLPKSTIKHKIKFIRLLSTWLYACLLVICYYQVYYQ